MPLFLNVIQSHIKMKVKYIKITIQSTFSSNFGVTINMIKAFSIKIAFFSQSDPKSHIVEKVNFTQIDIIYITYPFHPSL